MEIEPIAAAATAARRGDRHDEFAAPPLATPVEGRRDADGVGADAEVRRVPRRKTMPP